MDISAHRYANCLVITLKGRMDHLNAEPCREHLQPHLAHCTADGDVVIINLAGLDYTSSAGLRVLLIAAREAERQQGQLVMAAAPPLIEEIFQISRFNLVVRSFPTVQAAMADLAPQALERYNAA